MENREQVQIEVQTRVQTTRRIVVSGKWIFVSEHTDVTTPSADFPKQDKS